MYSIQGNINSQLMTGGDGVVERERDEEVTRGFGGDIATGQDTSQYWTQSSVLS